MSALRARLASGASAVGSFLQIAHPSAVEVMARLGFDVLCVEGEHSGLGVETVQALVAAADGRAQTLVRVADNAPVHIAAALDAGAAGVMVPRVNSAAEAAAAVRWARYPPEGERGLGPGRAAAFGLDLPDYLARAREETLVAIQIESSAAVSALDEILAVEGVDVVFVGPGDLALSLGVPLGARTELLSTTIEEVLAASRAAGRATGVWAATGDEAAAWLERGVQLVLVGSDLAFLAAGARAALAPVPPA